MSTLTFSTLISFSVLASVAAGCAAQTSDAADETPSAAITTDTKEDVTFACTGKYSNDPNAKGQDLTPWTATLTFKAAVSGGFLGFGGTAATVDFRGGPNNPQSLSARFIDRTENNANGKDYIWQQGTGNLAVYTDAKLFVDAKLVDNYNPAHDPKQPADVKTGEVTYQYGSGAFGGFAQSNTTSMTYTCTRQ